MYKRILAFALSVILLLALSVPMAFAKADKVEFSLSVTEGNVGDTVKVTVSMTEDSYFTNAILLLYYDSTAVRFVADSQAGGSISPKSNTMIMANAFPEKGYLKCAYVTVRSITKGGDLLTFDFDVIADKAAVFSLGFEECVGEDANEVGFDVVYLTKGCVLNDDGSATAPTVDSEKTTTAVTAVTTQNTSTASTSSGEKDSAGTTSVISGNTQNTNTSDKPQPEGTGSVEGNEIPGDAIPTVTQSQGEEGGSSTSSVVVDRTASSSTTMLSAVTQPQDENDGNGLVVGIVVVAVCLLIAVGVAVAAVKLRKNAEDNTAADGDETAAEDENTDE